MSFCGHFESIYTLVKTFNFVVKNRLFSKLRIFPYTCSTQIKQNRLEMKNLKNWQKGIVMNLLIESDRLVCFKPSETSKNHENNAV